MLRCALFLLLCTFTLASPLIALRDTGVTLPFVAKLNASGTNIAEADRARAASFKSKSATSSKRRRQTLTVDVTNQVVTYVASVNIGNPATAYTLLIDTGSSNTWVGAGTAYTQTSTSTDTGNAVSVSYGSGSFSGTEFIDTVSLSDDLTISNQSIGVANTSEGFDGLDGILGLGPTDLTEGTVDDTAEVPTITDNLASQGTITDSLVGIFFAPPTSESDTNGELSFGSADSSKFTGEISFNPLTSTSPANEFWGIDQSISYGTSNQTVLANTAGIVDTGTTLMLIATDAFNTYMQLTGATEDQTTGLLTISQENYANLQSLFFDTGSATLEFTADGQTWPRSLNTAIGGDTDSIYLVVADLGTNSGEGLDFINGYTFLERFYSVFDTTNNQVGFATTANTNSTQNSQT